MKTSANTQIFEKSLNGMAKRSQEVTSCLKFRNLVYKPCHLYTSNLIDLTDLIDRSNLNDLTSYPNQKDFNEFNDIDNIKVNRKYSATPQIFEKSQAGMTKRSQEVPRCLKLRNGI